MKEKTLVLMFLLAMPLFMVGAVAIVENTPDIQLYEVTPEMRERYLDVTNNKKLKKVVMKMTEWGVVFDEQPDPEAMRSETKYIDILVYFDEDAYDWYYDKGYTSLAACQIQIRQDVLLAAAIFEDYNQEYWDVNIDIVMPFRNWAHYDYNGPSDDWEAPNHPNDDWMHSLFTWSKDKGFGDSWWQEVTYNNKEFSQGEKSVGYGGHGDYYDVFIGMVDRDGTLWNYAED